MTYWVPAEIRSPVAKVRWVMDTFMKKYRAKVIFTSHAAKLWHRFHQVQPDLENMQLSDARLFQALEM